MKLKKIVEANLGMFIQRMPELGIRRKPMFVLLEKVPVGPALEGLVLLRRVDCLEESHLCFHDGFVIERIEGVQSLSVVLQSSQKVAIFAFRDFAEVEVKR